MKRLLLILAFCLPLSAALSVVESVKYNSNATTGVVFTLSGTPATNDVLLVFVSLQEPGYSVAPPAGWSTYVDQQGDNGSPSYVQLTVWCHVVTGGDGTTYTFPITGGSAFASGAMYQISGANATTPVNGHAIKNDYGNATSILSPSVTPLVTGTLAISALATVYGTAGSVTVSTVTYGWTLDQSAIPAYNAAFAASRNTLTADTSTPISVTYTLSNGGYAAVASTVLMAPAAASGRRRVMVITQ